MTNFDKLTRICFVFACTFILIQIGIRALSFYALNHGPIFIPIPGDEVIVVQGLSCSSD